MAHSTRPQSLTSSKLRLRVRWPVPSDSSAISAVGWKRITSAKAHIAGLVANTPPSTSAWPSSWKRLEVGRRGRGRARHHREREVLALLARLAALEEVGAGLAHVVGGHEQVGLGLGEPLVGEEALQRAVERGGVVLLVEQPLGAADALPHGAVEDAAGPPPRRARRAAPPGSASGAHRAQARMPPVEVPAIRSNSSQTRFPERCSISASTSAGISPRIPPPSMLSTRILAGRYNSGRACRLTLAAICCAAVLGAAATAGRRRPRGRRSTTTPASRRSPRGCAARTS